MVAFGNGLAHGADGVLKLKPQKYTKKLSSLLKKMPKQLMKQLLNKPLKKLLLQVNSLTIWKSTKKPPLLMKKSCLKLIGKLKFNMKKF